MIRPIRNHSGRSLVILLALSVCVLAAAAGTSVAYWPLNGYPVAGLGTSEINARIVSDGAGGAFVVYQEDNTGHGSGNDIVAKRIDAHGNILWTTFVSIEPGNQQNPAACLDPSTGGIFVVWEDDRYGGWDIFAIRVLPNGQTTGWSVGGLRVCAAFEDQNEVRVVSDQVGGAIIAWTDYRNWTLTLGDIYALRVNDSGNDVWANDGVLVCDADYSQWGTEMVSDGFGGAILVWQDFRDLDTDLYAQRLNAFGAAGWGSNGAVICNVANQQTEHRIISDGAGGVIAAWSDFRSGGPEVYAQRLAAAGNALWASTGVQATLGYPGGTPDLASDGANGAVIVAGMDLQYGGGWDIVAVHVAAGGDMQWAYQLTAGIAAQYWPSIAQAGNAGWVVAWQDFRSDSNFDIYAQRLSPVSGAPMWASDGVPLSVSYPDEQLAKVVTDENGNAIVCWRLFFGASDYDVYAQRISKAGTYGHPEPDLVSVADVPGDQGGHAMVTWGPSGLDASPQQVISHYTVWRQLGTTVALTAAEALNIVEPAEIGPDFEGTAYRQEVAAGTTTTWEFIATVPIRYAESYGFNAPTLNDWTASDPADETYQILAHTTSPWVFYESNLRSGHSVDNISPASPSMLAAQRVGNDVQLNWLASGADEPDFRDYAVYRATSSGVQPIPIHFVNSSGDLDYTDVAPPTGYLYYVVTATDVHGNQSAPSNEANIAIPTGVGDTPSLPKQLTLLANAPNPFNGSTAFGVGLPKASTATFEVYDVAGRRIRTAVVTLQAGWQSVAFDGRDEGGRALPSGVYFYRLHAAGSTLTRKMVIAR